MTTLNDVIQPLSIEIEPLLPTALQGKEPDEFITFTLKNIVSLLQSNPMMYRTYGAYWFSIKKMIIERLGYYGFGAQLGVGEVEIFNYKKDELTILASYLYANERIESGATYSGVHTLATTGVTGDDSYTYELVDNDMEQLIQIKNGMLV